MRVRVFTLSRTMPPLWRESGVGYAAARLDALFLHRPPGHTGSNAWHRVIKSSIGPKTFPIRTAQVTTSFHGRLDCLGRGAYFGLSPGSSPDEKRRGSRPGYDLVRGFNPSRIWGDRICRLRRRLSRFLKSETGFDPALKTSASIHE